MGEEEIAVLLVSRIPDTDGFPLDQIYEEWVDDSSEVPVAEFQSSV